MTKWIALALIATSLTACRADESVAAYGAADKTWRLVSIDGTAFEAVATMQFGDKGVVSGQAPCNRWFANQGVPYPWFEISAIGATKMACPDLAAEAEFFSGLEAMTLSEVSGDVLVLSNDAGRSMEFKAE